MNFVEKACNVFNNQPSMKGKFWKYEELDAMNYREKREKDVLDLIPWFRFHRSDFDSVSKEVEWTTGAAIFANEDKTFIIVVNG
jgi:hypothetical protein